MVEVSLTVGKLDASLALLLTKDHHLIEFPTILLPNGVKAGSIVKIKCDQDLDTELEELNKFQEIQNEILTTFGKNLPQQPRLKIKNVTQTSCVLEWAPVELGTASLKNLILLKDGKKLGAIPQPLTNRTTKLSGLPIDKTFQFQLKLDTTAGVYLSETIEVTTHKMTDLSGINACLGDIAANDQFTVDDIQDTLRAMGANHPAQDKVRVDTTHFIATRENKQNPEFLKANEMNIPIIRPEWLKACERERRIVGVRDFYVKDCVLPDIFAKDFWKKNGKVVLNVPAEVVDGSTAPTDNTEPENAADPEIATEAEAAASEKEVSEIAASGETAVAKDSENGAAPESSSEKYEKDAPKAAITTDTQETTSEHPSEPSSEKKLSEKSDQEPQGANKLDEIPLHEDEELPAEQLKEPQAGQSHTEIPLDVDKELRENEKQAVELQRAIEKQEEENRKAREHLKSDLSNLKVEDISNSHTDIQEPSSDANDFKAKLTEATDAAKTFGMQEDGSSSKAEAVALSSDVSERAQEEYKRDEIVLSIENNETVIPAEEYSGGLSEQLATNAGSSATSVDEPPKEETLKRTVAEEHEEDGEEEDVEDALTLVPADGAKKKAGKKKNKKNKKK